GYDGKNTLIYQGSIEIKIRDIRYVNGSAWKLERPNPIVGKHLFFELNKTIQDEYGAHRVNEALVDWGDGKTELYENSAGITTMIAHTYDIAEIVHPVIRLGCYTKDEARLYVTDNSYTFDLRLKPADVLLHCKESADVSMIPGPWTHAAMYIGNNQIIEAYGAGVVISPISKFSYPNDYCVGIYRYKELNDQERLNIVNFAKEKVGRSYDWESLVFGKQQDCTFGACEHFLPFFPKLYADCRARMCWNYYCSELVWAAFKKNDRNLYWIPGPVTPYNLIQWKTDERWEIIGTHIEQIPDRLLDYKGQDYYKALIAGEPKRQKKITALSHEMPGVTSDNGCMMDVSAPSSPDLPSPVEMTIIDPTGKKLTEKEKTTTIPNATFFEADLSGDGILDDISGLTRPIGGLYRIILKTESFADMNDTYTLNLNVWGFDNDNWDNDQNMYIQDVIPDIPMSELVKGREFWMQVVEDENDCVMIALPVKGEAPLNVTFVDISLLDNQTRSWSFGDGTFAGDVNNITHTYTTPGTYTASLHVWNSTITSNLSAIITVSQDNTGGPVLSSVLPTKMKQDEVVPMIWVIGKNLKTGDIIGIERDDEVVSSVKGLYAGFSLIGKDLNLSGLNEGFYDLSVTDQLTGKKGVLYDAITITRNDGGKISAIKIPDVAPPNVVQFKPIINTGTQPGMSETGKQNPLDAKDLIVQQR
ncbi:MAG TPA: PKD domain-containing protein, partial [Methanospirillum sp.]|uniref:PKD domain-containing protein n=1 Tax=Methanospirillum sp. TaxID=45200 RepID=UPI002C81E34F